MTHFCITHQVIPLVLVLNLTKTRFFTYVMEPDIS